MISLWSQRLGQLLTCSRTMAAPTVHVWDLAAERCVQRLLSGLDGADHHITSLCEVGGAHSRAVLAAGASDGSIRLYDCRSGLFSFVQVAAEHRASIVGLASHGAPAVAPVVDAPAGLSHGGTRCDLISGDVGGEVRFWDARTWSSALAADSHRIEMSCLALHERAPVRARAAQAGAATVTTRARARARALTRPVTRTRAWLAANCARARARAAGRGRRLQAADDQNLRRAGRDDQLDPVLRWFPRHANRLSGLPRIPPAQAADGGRRDWRGLGVDGVNLLMLMCAQSSARRRRRRRADSARHWRL